MGIVTIWCKKGNIKHAYVLVSLMTTIPGTIHASAVIELSIGHSLQMPSECPPCLELPSFEWLTCLPPFFGLCLAPVHGPALLQALQAPLWPAGGPSPDAHRQPCSHLKGEARHVSKGKLLDLIQSTTLTTHCRSHWLLVSDVRPNEVYHCLNASGVCATEDNSRKFDTGSRYTRDFRSIS